MMEIAVEKSRIKLKTRILLLCVLPVACVIILVLWQTAHKLNTFKKNQIVSIEKSAIENKKTRLSLIVNIAISSMQHLLDQPPSKERDKQVISLINQLSYDNGGYFFANTNKHIGLANGRKPENFGKDYNKILSPDALSRFNEMVSLAENGGGFLETRTKKKGQNTNDTKEYLKITHVKKIPHYDWYLGTGFFIDDIQATTKQKAKEFNSTTMHILISISIFAAILMVAAFIVGWLFVRNPLDALTNMHKVMKNIASGDGDLTQQLAINSRDEIGECALSFNAFSDKLRHTVSDIIQTSSNINNARDKLDQSTQKSVTSMQTQKQQVESFKVSTDALYHSAKKITENTNTALELADKTHNESNKTVVSLDLAIQKVNELNGDIDQSSEIILKLGEEVKTIGSVIDVIQSIAEQTNLLALNAAIEAARAGEQGRGFAVVADEVRTLASRTQTSTEEINSMISNLQDGASKAINAMNVSQTRSTSTLLEAQNSKSLLESMAVSVKQINDMNTEIAKAANKQTEVTGQLNHNSKLLLTMTEGSAQEIRSISLISHDLKESSDILQAKTAYFRV